ncbi:MAG: 30S ribosomal protein S6 [Trueperaceae bacterium]
MPSNNQYDLNLILDPNLSEQQVQTEKDAVATQVERVGGEIIEVDEWGSRRLAYPIRKLNEGYYVIYRLNLTGETPKAVEAAIRQRDNVMRVLVVKDRPEWKTRKPAAPQESQAAD